MKKNPTIIIFPASLICVCACSLSIKWNLAIISFEVRFNVGQNKTLEHTYYFFLTGPQNNQQMNQGGKNNSLVCFGLNGFPK